MSQFVFCLLLKIMNYFPNYLFGYRMNSNMKLFRSSVVWCQLSLFLAMIATEPAIAEESNQFLDEVQLEKRSLFSISYSLDSNQLQQLKKIQFSTSAKDLLAQQNGITKVTGVQLNQTDAGLQIILETSTEETLVPLILPEGNNLAIDLLDATLALPTGNEFREINPTEGIAEVTLTQIDDTSIRLTITGENQTPSAEVIPSQQNLVLSVTPEGVTTEQTPDEEIEIIATGEVEAEDDYYVPNATSATRSDAEIRDIPQSIQVIPQEVIKEQQAISLEEIATDVSSVVFSGNNDGRGNGFSIRGFNNAPILRDGFRLYGFFQGQPEVANLESVEILKGPASVLYGEIEPGGLINLVSKQPQAEPVYDLQLQLGNRDLVSPSLDFTGALTESGNLKYRLNALYRSEESFRDYEDGFDRFFIAPTLAWQVGDNTDISFNLEYIEDDDPADFGTVIVDGEPANIPPERITNNPDDTVENTFINTGYTLEHRFNENWKLRNAFRYLANDYDYGGDNEDILALPFEIDEETGILTRVFADQERQEDSFTLYTNVEGNFKIGAIEHNLLFGIDLNRTEGKQITNFDPVPSSF
jgi:iron complex outermembrane receptor protein